MRSLRSFLLASALFGLAAGPATAAAPPADFRPDPASVQRHGPGYRYPQAGWVVLHIEGKPYDRGYQHGRLMPTEIAACVRAIAAMQSEKAPAEAWKLARSLTSALFLRKFDREYLEEMQGIADGAAAGGARFDNRPIDLLDVAAINCWMELETLESALEALPTGLEGVKFPKHQARAMPAPPADHCSAFAAVGPATADGQIVFGHITMSSLLAANICYVWLDVKPAQGQRCLMQTYPGGIQSGQDYYLNGAGILITETTLAQTRYEINSAPLASRIRQAVQYADSIDKAVELLTAGNNGLYTNEWLIADVNRNEIAMFELGTHKTKLWRSSKNEWYGGTPGFYWGCNNTKDLEVRLETIPAVNDRPANMVWRPSPRDRQWVELYEKHKGKITGDFGREAFTSTPLAAYHSLDAKYTTTALAKDLKTWAIYGPPLGRTWLPTPEEKAKRPEVRPLVSNPWTVLHAGAPEKPGADIAKAVDLSDTVVAAAADKHEREEDRPRPTDPAWHGTVLAKTDADVWLAAAFAEYERVVARANAAREKSADGKLPADDRNELARELYSFRSRYLAASRSGADTPLDRIRHEFGRDDWYEVAVGKGVLLLHELRGQLGGQVFDDAMDSFGREHAGQPVTTAEFRAHLEKASGRSLEALFTAWTTQPGLPANGKAKSDLPTGGVYTVLSFHREPERSLIVYGTADETATNREAAQLLQQAIRARWSNVTVPVRRDNAVTDEELRTHHVLIVGRPGTNALAERWRDAVPVRFGTGSFTVGPDTYAHALSAVAAAGENPANPRYSVVVLTGLGAYATRQVGETFMHRAQSGTEVLVLPSQGKAKALVLPAREPAKAVGTQ
jgi:hypothetical protein